MYTLLPYLQALKEANILKKNAKNDEWLIPLIIYQQGINKSW